MGKAGPKAWTPTPEQLKEAELRASQGCTYEQIASFLGMSRSTLDRGRKAHGELEAAVKRGTDERIRRDSERLEAYIAEGDKLGLTALIFRMKCRNGWRERVEVTDAEGKPVIPPTLVKISGKEGKAIAALIGQATRKTANT